MTGSYSKGNLLMTTARVIVSLLVATSGLAFIGCADADPTSSDSKVLASVDTNVTPQWSPPLTGGTCPDPSYSKEATEWYQAKATTVIQYLVGGKEPFTSDELSYNSDCKAAFNNLVDLRNMVTPTVSAKGATATLATLKMVSSGTVCTLPSSLYALDFSYQVSTSVWDTQQKVGAQLDGCWGIGVSGFYYADPSNVENKTRRIYIDPEPARMVKDLIGLTGATAAAVYSNTGTAVDAVKYPASWVNVASPAAPGLPCSTTDLAAGNETFKVLQASGTWRRCY